MDLSDLEKLHAAVGWLLRQESFSKAVEHLRVELNGSHEPFVWTTVAADTIRVPLPAPIKSCWVFLLKRDVPSGSHYHPNSVQHMVALNGRGRSNVGGVERTLIPFGSARHAIEDKWHVIGEGVPHEFFPEGEDMTVVSFHTCAAAELEEIASGSGARRIYEPLGSDRSQRVAAEPGGAAGGGRDAGSA
jgi:mannose-6-phosphate isomerase-like protein (cupin superfamily)